MSAVQLALIFDRLSHGFTPEQVAADLEIDPFRAEKESCKIFRTFKDC